MEALDNKVLYIDDEETNLALFKACYATNYEIFTANNTANAEVLIQQHCFKVIISDIRMPNENGIEFFKRIRFTCNEPILILLTAYMSNDFLLEALHHGRIFRYLTKPWKREDLMFTIDQAIQMYDLQFQNRQLFLQMEESERKFHNIFHQSQDSIVIFDRNEFILEANKTFLDYMKQDAEEITKSKISDLLDNENKHLLRERLPMLTHSFTAINEFSFVHPNGEKRIVETNSCLIDYKGTQACLSVIRDITERKTLEQKILNAIVQAEEHERSRIAKDLHDGLGPVMVTLKMYLEWLNEQSRMADHPDILDLSLLSINEAITTVKSISNNLSPHVLETFGLMPALSAYVEKMKKISDIQFQIDTNTQNRLMLMAEISVYRIMIECINNTLKYSNATEVNIRAWKTENIFTITYADNGNGFDVSAAFNENKGMGLYNIKNRIKSIGGTVNIASSPGKGVQITIEINLNQKN
jgi:PAS domain S-box-containing protein